MGISKSILKRIQAVENALNAGHCPELIMIDYDAAKQKYVINETYTSETGKETKRNTLEVDLLQEYVFAPGFMGVCIMDLLDAPIKNANLYTLRAEEIRTAEEIPCGVGFKIFIDEEQPSDRQTKITIEEV